MFRILQLLGLLAVIEACPKVELAKHNCRCTAAALFGARVSCKGSTNLQIVVDILRDVPMKSLQLSSLSDGSLPSSLCALRVEEIVLSDMENVKFPLPKCDFKSLCFDNVSLPSDFFDHLGGNVRSLSFLHTNLTLTGIEDLSQIHSLNFYNVHVNLGEHLRRLNNLHELQIINSSLATNEIQRNQLPIDGSLRTLVLKNTNLHAIPDDFLDGLNSLSSLDLSSNHIVGMNESALAQFHGTINLHGNPLHCDELVWLRRRQLQKTIQIFSGVRTACATPPSTYFDELLPEGDGEHLVDPLELSTEHDLGTAPSLVFPLALCGVCGLAALIVFVLFLRKDMKRRPSFTNMSSTSLL